MIGAFQEAVAIDPAGGAESSGIGAPGESASTRSTAGEGQTFAGNSLIARYASFVKLPHTLFALPFAGVGAILATYTTPERITIETAAWILVAFTAARFAAMGFNRIVDRYHDALNPRTRLRELPSGRLSQAQANVAVGVASAVFIVAAWQLNRLCGLLSPLALGWVFFYSYTKRFTAGAHTVLGFALSIAPVGAYLAVTGVWSDPWWALLLLAGGVTCWVAGFDVIYAIQDRAFDREHGLHSIPARVGVHRSLLIVRVLHLLSVLAFLGIWALDAFAVGWVYLGGVGVMAVLLRIEHSLVGGDPEALDLARIDRAFFRMNVWVSTSFLVFVLADRLIAS